MQRIRAPGHRLAGRHPGDGGAGPFTLLAILSPRPAIFWPAMFVTLLLLFLDGGPVDAAMTNLAASPAAIHLLGDAPSAAVGATP